MADVNPWGEGPRPAVGRYKDVGGGQLAWDPNDTGPDQPAGGYSSATSPPAQPSYNTSTFTDPATKNYENLINSLTNRLNAGYTPPDYGPTVDYMRKYFEQLQGPAYTPAQLDVMQTQALDPLERQRQAARQQVIQRLASHGIAPSSGIVEKALQDVDNQYNTIRAQTQSHFATNAIDTQKRQLAQAAGVGQGLTGMEQGQYDTETNRLLQGVQLAGIMPQLSWNRLLQANGVTGGTNPISLLGLSNDFQTQGYNQSNAYLQYLMQALMGAFGGGGGY